MKLVIILGLVGLSLALPQHQQRRQRLPQQSFNIPQQQFNQRQGAGRALQQPQQPIDGIDNSLTTILRSEIDHKEDGSFNYAWETSDGSAAEQTGFLKDLQDSEGLPAKGIAVQGSYQYYTPEGQLIRITYTADERGFIPSGEHLPTPPPIPEAIQRSLELIYRNADIQRERAAQQQQAQQFDRRSDAPFRGERRLRQNRRQQQF